MSNQKTDVSDNAKLSAKQSKDNTDDVNAHKALLKVVGDHQKADIAKEASIGRQITAIGDLNKNHDKELTTLTQDN